MSAQRQTVTHLSLEVLIANPANIRDDPGDLSDLAASIREHGILQPLTVTEHGADNFVLIAGHRRLGAARLAGLRSVPVVIRHDVTDRSEHLILMLVENVQRRDLSPVEKAEAFGALRNRGLTLSDIARRTGIHLSTISALVALLDLDDASRDEIRRGHLSAGDAMKAVREVRQAQRVGAGGVARGRPVVVEPAHFGDLHPLIHDARSICGHTTRPKVGQSLCCGQCWEAVIRADARGEPMPEPAFDEAIVRRIMAGDNAVNATSCDRIEVVRRWRLTGRSLAELARRTGWKVERYYRVGETVEVAS